MGSVSALILFPLVASGVIFLVRNQSLRGVVVKISALITVILTLLVVFKNFQNGLYTGIENSKIADNVILVAELLVAIYLFVAGIRHKKYMVPLLVAIQVPLMLWFEFTHSHGIEVKTQIVLDKLSAVMVLIVGIIGSLIAIYAVGYMKDYHKHNKEIKDRQSSFLSLIFLFLSAMFGLVLTNNLMWLYFCWEITTLCSFLLIGYTKTEEAVNNSFRALAMNLLGGLAFACAIVFTGIKYKTLELSVLTSIKPEAAVMIPVFLLSFAAITKSAQLPFSSWLLGAMVAPTPSSALLHSATMVKAGVYLAIRLSPLLGTTAAGRTVTLVGGVTFLACSIMAISQWDAKKILAYSTIANLGLIMICAGIGTQESLWAAILLVIFHAVSKSLLFISVGSAEHQIGSRNVEDMDVLMRVSSELSLYMLIGIAGMFLAPFGMLISKWAAMKAFIDSDNILILVILAFGSAATLFYWTKWMGKLVSAVRPKDRKKHLFPLDEHIPIFIHAALVIILCITFPLISKYVLIPYISELFGSGAIMPIGISDIYIMLGMIIALLVLPLAFLPLYKNNRRRVVSVYMAGENTGDNETFRGSDDTPRRVELRNWYMDSWFGPSKLTLPSNIISVVIMCVGALLIAGGLL